MSRSLKSISFVVALATFGFTGVAQAGVDFLDESALFIGTDRVDETIFNPFESIPEV